MGRRARLTSASGKLRSWAAACVPKTGGKKKPLPYLVKAALGLGEGRLQPGGRRASPPPNPIVPWIGATRVLRGLCKRAKGMDGSGRGG